MSAWKNRPDREVSDESVVLNRRAVLKKAAVAAGSIAAVRLSAGCRTPQGSSTTTPYVHPGPGRPITPQAKATGYNNFYEFTTDKEAVRELAADFQTYPWTVEVTGAVERPQRFDIDSMTRTFATEERIYRFRCVEAWAMTVPWTGFELRALLEHVRPLKRAKYVRFVTFAEGAPGIDSQPWYPWPYHEALTIEEASHPLTMLATGLYGRPLPNQNGAPIRLVVPWKYGFKSAKSLVRIELTEAKPETFWNSLNPSEYGFFSNVDPEVPHPRWSQASERLIDTGERVPTLPFNGYGEQVAALYPDFAERRARYR